MYLPMYFNTLIAVLALVARELLQSWLSLAHAWQKQQIHQELHRIPAHHVMASHNTKAPHFYENRFLCILMC